MAVRRRDSGEPSFHPVRALQLTVELSRGAQVGDYSPNLHRTITAEDVAAVDKMFPDLAAKRRKYRHSPSPPFVS